MNAEELTKKFQEKYLLTYRCGVNLEGTINNMIFYGLTFEQIEDILEDIYNNLDFCEFLENERQN